MNILLDPEYWKDATLRDVKRAIEEGADPLEISKWGDAPIMWAAAFSEDPKIIKLLLDKGEDPEFNSSSGQTPLSQAAHYNTNPDIIQILIDRGADTESRNRAGQTPLIIAAVLNENPDVIETLIDNGANIHAVDKRGLGAWFALQKNKKLKRNKKAIALLEPARRDSYRGDYRRTRLDRARRYYR